MNDTQLDKQQQGSRAEAVQQRPAVAPRVDIFENKDEVLLVADMPGVSKEGLNIHLDHEQLTVEGRVLAETAGRLLAREWRPFDFRRSFLVPKGIDAEKVSAELKQGVLYLHLPKSEAVKPRRVPVQAE
jgi:HSP20 family protein